MYAISNALRVYVALILFLCSSFFLAPTLANAAEGYWSTQERRFVSQSEVNRNVQRILDTAVNKPSGSTLGAASSAPTISKNPLGGLSQTTQNTIKTMGQPSSFESTLNNSAGSAKNALKSCVRSPACAGRALGAGAIIYEGIHAWKEVYDILLEENGTIVKLDPKPYNYTPNNLPAGVEVIGSCGNNVPPCVLSIEKDEFGPRQPSRDVWCNANHPAGTFLGSVFPAVGGSYCVYYMYSQGGDIPYPPSRTEPVSQSDLDSMIDQGYEPEVSDAPIVLLSGEPESITLSTPASAELPSTTTTNISSGGQTTTSVTNSTINYTITNNNTSNPSINSELVETTTTYDTTGNVTDTTTSTTTAIGVQPDVPTPSPSAPLDLELPSFCTWASIVCEWIGWTKEGIEGEEPDLINLISEFEPDDNQYNSGIGSGSCPAPMSLNLGIINRVVELSYQPFCDFLDMIRPLVIAGAWLLSAFMYVGVLRRG